MSASTTEPALAGLGPETPLSRNARPSPWLWVMCLLGIDYFSSLAYQPSATFEVAGLLGPFATLAVVLMTLLGALPVYFYVAGRSSHGLGSTWLLERLVHGWVGKTLVLLLLGFAATDFVMVKTLSLADAAEHVIHNEFPPWQQALSDMARSSKDGCRTFLGEAVAGFFNERLVVTILLGALGFVFWWILRSGFNRNVILVAVPIVGLYLLLNAWIIGNGLAYLFQNPERLRLWHERVLAGDWQLRAEPWWPGRGTLSILVLCLLFFPHLSLGLSGFEMSLIVMPQVKGKPGDDTNVPAGRIRNTRKVLIAAALIMSIYLLGSVLVSTLLIPPEELVEGGRASNRALAYLAHGGPLTPGPGPRELGPLFGNVFGTLYDLNTVVLLCLTGTGVITALAAILPQFLLRFGMELKWVHRWGVLFLGFASVNLLVTVWFDAKVSTQRGAYATGVMALITSTCMVTVLDRFRARKAGPWWWRLPWGYTLIAFLFLAAGVAVVFADPRGILISACFVFIILTTSVVSRALRSDELRTVGFTFADEDSKFLWDCMRSAEFPVLIPHRPGRHERDLKEVSIRKDHQLDPDVDLVFIEVCVDDPSNFYQQLRLKILREDNRFVIQITHCVSVPHAIAAIALELSKVGRPPGLHFGWSEMDLLAASWSYLAFGEGNVPWKVRELILDAEPDAARQPRVIIG
jgi:hypothetical protein